MNEQEQKLIDLYMSNVRKRKIIIFIIIIIFFILGIILFKIYTNNVKPTILTANTIENTVDIQGNVLNNATKNKTSEESNIPKTDDNNEKSTSTEDSQANTQKAETVKETSKNEVVSSNKQIEAKTEQTSTKPANKDFLFSDGYTMENVSQVAQDYLKSSGFSGECVPLKDDEGVYYRNESYILLTKSEKVVEKGLTNSKNHVII